MRTEQPMLRTRTTSAGSKASKVRQQALTEILGSCPAQCQRAKLHKFSKTAAQQISKSSCVDISRDDRVTALRRRRPGMTKPSDLAALRTHCTTWVPFTARHHALLRATS